MHVVVVHAHPSPTSYGAALREAVVRGLESAGHDVDVIDLYAERFAPAMTATERRGYESDSEPVDAQCARHARLVRRASGLVFVYPTWWFGLPAILKGWLDRVLVPGVAFHLDPRSNKVRSDLRHVTHLAGVTTSGASRRSLRFFGDTGRWTIRRTLRILCGIRCSTAWHHLDRAEQRSDSDRKAFLESVERRFRRW